MSKAKMYYIRLAIVGTGQEDVKEIELSKITDYLESYARKVAGQDWDIWLEALGLNSYKSIKLAVLEIGRENNGKKKTR